MIIFEGNRFAYRAAVEVLSGIREAKGRLPYTLDLSNYDTL